MTGANPQSGPARTCVACRERRPADQLVRLVAQGDRVVPDLRRMRSGRGAHLCPSMACLGRAVKRRSFRRAFRAQVCVDPVELREALVRAFEAEAQRVDASSRIRQADEVRGPWLAKALREFTLTRAGAMNRGPASGGPSSSSEDGAKGRTENA